MSDHVDLVPGCLLANWAVVGSGAWKMWVETLVEMLEYSPNEADSFKFKAESDDGQVKVFNSQLVLNKCN